jgi:hypothetical protein
VDYDDAAILPSAASTAESMAEAASFMKDLGALAQTTARVIPGGQVHLLGNIGKSPIYGSLVTGVGIASVDGMTMIIRTAQGNPMVLGPFR